MRNSKYLVLNSFYFDFNDDLTDIEKVKELFNKQNVLDLFRYNELKSIRIEQFTGYNIDLIYLPKNIEIIGNWAFANNKIEILDLSFMYKVKIY